MQKYQDTVVTGSTVLVPLAGATITIANTSGGSSTMYSDNGITPIASTTTDSSGRFSFYAADGRYTITITSIGLSTITVTDVLLEDPANANPLNATTLTASGQITSTVATGTAPLVVASTTPVANLTTEGNALLAGNVAQDFSASNFTAATSATVPVATTSTHAAQASQTRIKNDIINGQFRIAQAGTSFAAPASGSYDLDGWAIVYGGTSAVVTVAQVAGETAGKFARQVTVTTADAAVGTSDYFQDFTKIEGFNVAKHVGNTFTIAFRAKVPVAGIHCVNLRNIGADRCYVHEINFPAANTWQDCTFTVVGGLPTAGTWNYTNGVGLDIGFVHMAGTLNTATNDTWNVGNLIATANQVNDCATNGNVWAMEDVRIAPGTFCPPDSSTYDEDLRITQRYARPMFAAGCAYSTIGAVCYQDINTMRAVPLITAAAGAITLNNELSGAVTGLSVGGTNASTVNKLRVAYTYTATASGFGVPTYVTGFLEARL